MPSNKKKSSAAKKQQKQARVQRQEAAQTASHNLHAYSDQFRNILLKARKEYAKGRSYDAVEMQKEAIQLGEENLPRFNENSFVKAHALIDMGLALSAIATDFASGDEWKQTVEEMNDTFQQALDIFEARRLNGTLTKFRKVEIWMDASGMNYSSPAPHTERLGPIDYFTVIKFHVAGGNPSPDTVRILQGCIHFLENWQAKGMTLQLECGGVLQGETGVGNGVDTWTAALHDHQQVLAGVITRDELMSKEDKEKYKTNHKEKRHTGTRGGKMKSSHKKLDKDASKVGLKFCANLDCKMIEPYANNFSTCARCCYTAYCSRDCQKVDWKRHKKECKEKAKLAKEEEIQNKSLNCLLIGESQQVLNVVKYWHHFALKSEELQNTVTEDSSRVQFLVRPKVDDLEFGEDPGNLTMQDIALTWNAIWSMELDERKKMTRRFVKEINKFSWPRGIPDFSVARSWASHGVHGVFALVKHTPKGSVLLHEDDEGKIKGYLSVGITQSVQSLLVSVRQPLPIFINTSVIPFKKIILCQGTIMPAMGGVSSKLNSVAASFVQGSNESGVEVLEVMPMN
eukprot:CAMPEP_0194076180 /NCGR_PEP_ID=MMETSP0149-20130528/3024_1 /TAXON_ID=122233 /ORGANISM="Chaetoceros debilis, Strain MM31A-1" /LENGTH=569 /DNA_ID=CAMNT_0038756851 /DNA_START=66 /DNA_END=1775 /DNA_ORIENTATION=+